MIDPQIIYEIIEMNIPRLYQDYLERIERLSIILIIILKLKIIITFNFKIKEEINIYSILIKLNFLMIILIELY